MQLLAVSTLTEIYLPRCLIYMKNNSCFIFYGSPEVYVVHRSNLIIKPLCLVSFLVLGNLKGCFLVV